MTISFVNFERWITTAPIIQRSAEEYTCDVKTMWKSVENYHAAVEPKKSWFWGLFSRSSETPPPVAPDKDSIWEQNYEGLTMMLKLYLHNDNGLFFTYFLDGKPIGVMTLKPPGMYGSFTIKHIATHPAVQACGGTMMEYALYYAGQNAWVQKINLSPLNAGARAAYKALGFKPMEGLDYMELDPAASDGVWQRVGSDWRIAKYVGQNYLVM